MYNAVRPITFIRSKIDATWTSLLTTPPFPEYSSGHSVQSGALAKVLSESFGLDYTFTDKTHAARTDIDGSPRTYKSFYELASEAAVSRVYGGIHFREAVERGIEQGVRVGAAFTNLNSFKMVAATL